MPELYPGMLIQIPYLDFQAYVTTVSHSFQFGRGGGFSTANTATFSSNGTISSRLTYAGIMANYYTDTFINKKGEGGKIVVEGDASGYYQKTSIWSSTIITPTVQADTYGDHYAISGHAAVRSQRKF